MTKDEIPNGSITTADMPVSHSPFDAPIVNQEGISLTIDIQKYLIILSSFYDLQFKYDIVLAGSL